MTLQDPRIITGNKAKIETEDLDANSERSKKAKSMLADHGKMMAPRNGKYLGTAVVHYYQLHAGRTDGLIVAGKDEWTVICESHVTNVPEGLADFGWKQLKESLMKAFGRRQPRKVT